MIIRSCTSFRGESVNLEILQKYDNTSNTEFLELATDLGIETSVDLQMALSTTSGSVIGGQVSPAFLKKTD